MLRMRALAQTRRIWGVLSAFVILVGVISGLAVARAMAGQGADAVADVRAASDDAEWLAIIDAARRARAEPNGAWPEGRVQEGVTVVRACGAVPAGAEVSDAAIEYSPNELKRRLVVNYFARPDTRYQLILYEDSDLSGCTDGIRRTLTERDVRREDVDAHICAEMWRTPFPLLIPGAASITELAVFESGARGSGLLHRGLARGPTRHHALFLLDHHGRQGRGPYGPRFRCGAARGHTPRPLQRRVATTRPLPGRTG